MAFEALANVPRPSKPELFGMDILHNVSCMQPNDLFCEEPCDQELDLGADDLLFTTCDCKPSHLSKRSTMCTSSPALDLEEIGTQTFDSFLSHGTVAAETNHEHVLPPNRLLHEQHNVRMNAFLTAVMRSSTALETKVELFRNCSAAGGHQGHSFGLRT